MSNFVTYLCQRFRDGELLESPTTNCKMNRDLGAIKLTILGIGSTIGAGIYIVLGVAAKEVAGPSIVISFLLAGLGTLIGCLCFAQYAFRIPNGGLYQYIIHTYGQFSAFIVVWVALIGAALMAAVSAQGISNCLDSYINFTVSDFTRDYIAEWPSSCVILDKPNILAIVLVAASTVIVSRIRVNNFSAIVNFLAFLNISVLTLFIILGILYGKMTNILIYQRNESRFFAFGLTGVLRGAALAFTAYGGFEFICMAVQETKRPEKTVPRALIACVIVTTILNTSTSVAFVALQPFREIDETSPLVGAVHHIGLYAIDAIILTGPVIGMSCSLVLGIYAVSRLLFSIAEQGLIDSRLATLLPETNVPMNATIVTGILISLATSVFQIDKLASLVTLGVLTIMTYISYGSISLMHSTPYHMDLMCKDDFINKDGDFLKQSYKSNVQTRLSKININILILVQFLSGVSMSCLLVFEYDTLISRNPVVLTGIILSGTLFILTIVCLALYPSSISQSQLRLGPLIPALSGFVNTFFFVSGLDSINWILYLALICIGIFIWTIVCVIDYARDVTVSGTKLYSALPDTDDEFCPELKEFQKLNAIKDTV